MRVKDIPGSHQQLKGDMLLDTSHIKCPVCLELSPLADWEEAEAFCEECGYEHNGMRCPKCQTPIIPYLFGTIEVVNLSSQ